MVSEYIIIHVIHDAQHPLLKKERVCEGGKNLKKQKQNTQIMTHTHNVDDESEDEVLEVQLNETQANVSTQLVALPTQLEEIIVAQVYVPGGQPRNQSATQGNFGGGYQLPTEQRMSP